MRSRFGRSGARERGVGSCGEAQSLGLVVRASCRAIVPGELGGSCCSTDNRDVRIGTNTDVIKPAGIPSIGPRGGARVDLGCEVGQRRAEV